ncbi:hypothetical protein [Bacterioplanoides sp. SCSIO 12839]|uniref:hypothetical protein n=1 Tax=Bacterioplanoides sp. SCSIO 12839 TaxID=2829569 RepID=UPI0021070D94|nr:hypothetical protein [Bacterioplanoides sp. SCSIO 12839]UTW49954.1 hypothetical protein KFF03_08750 [Bacterioplanoides sp. SCSIO 12839]
MDWLKSRLNSTASRITAAILGAFLTTITLTIAITLSWPFGDKVEQIFAGGVFFFVFWASLFYWALLATNGLKAWARVGGLFIAFGLYDLLSLTVFS